MLEEKNFAILRSNNDSAIKNCQNVLKASFLVAELRDND
jgi:hypothetical protein